MENRKPDTVFLQLAKALAKVDHEVFLVTVVKDKLERKTGLWIKEFLTKRRFKIVSNIAQSAEEIVSGVPQGTVLAPLLFIIRISERNMNVERSVVTCYSDHTNQ